MSYSPVPSASHLEIVGAEGLEGEVERQLRDSHEVTFWASEFPPSLPLLSNPCGKKAGIRPPAKELSLN